MQNNYIFQPIGLKPVENPRFWGRKSSDNEQQIIEVNGFHSCRFRYKNFILSSQNFVLDNRNRVFQAFRFDLKTGNLICLLLVLMTMMFFCGGCSKNEVQPEDQSTLENQENSHFSESSATGKTSTEIIEINGEQEFLDLVDNNSIVVIDFNADWCGPCQKLKPDLENIAIQYKDQGLKVGSVNIDANLFHRQFGVQGIPDVRIFVNGRSVEKIIGCYPEEIRTAVENAIQQNNSETSEDIILPRLTTETEAIQETMPAFENEFWPEDVQE